VAGINLALVYLLPLDPPPSRGRRFGEKGINLKG